MGSSGQGGAKNVNWTATVPAGQTVVINGRLSCIDSDQGSWSTNPASGGKGFCDVEGTNAIVTIPGVPPLTPPPGSLPASKPTCAPTPPSTFLVYPSKVAAGGTTSLLLWCGRPVSLGFQGAFAPLAVLIYDSASFNNLRYVKGFLMPISPSLPVRPPIVPAYRVAGPNDVDVSLPPSMLRGIYTVVIVWSSGEVASMNLLSVS